MPTLSEALEKASRMLHEVAAGSFDTAHAAAIAAEIDEYRVARLQPPPGSFHGTKDPPDFEMHIEPTIGLVHVGDQLCRVWVGTLAGVEIAALVLRVTVPEGADSTALDEMLFRAVAPEKITALGVEAVAIQESPILLREIDKLVEVCRPHVRHGETAADVAVRLIQEARDLVEESAGPGGVEDDDILLRLKAFLAPWENQVAGTPLISREELQQTADELRNADHV